VVEIANLHGVELLTGTQNPDTA